jgi:hypothetical protein
MLKKFIKAPFKILKIAAGAVKSGGRYQPSPTKQTSGKPAPDPKKS